MRSLQILPVLAFASSLALASTPARAQDQPTGDPVADAARRAREEKKTAAKPKKVFTDDDVTPKPAEQPAPATAATDSESAERTTVTRPAASKATTEQKEDPNSEQSWRKRFAEQRRKISDAETELDVLQREASKTELQYYPDPQKAMQEQFTRDEINKKNAAIDAKKKVLADLKQQLNDMEDQLRASGGDIGWSR